jgi:hypothetical protein
MVHPIVKGAGLVSAQVTTLTMSHSKAVPHLLARDRQIPALHGKIGAQNGDLAIPFEQKKPVCVKCDIVKVYQADGPHAVHLSQSLTGQSEFLTNQIAGFSDLA